MSGDSQRVLVWDWTVRLFHWVLVLGVALMWWTGEEGLLLWHKRLGIFLLGLVVYRIVWGLIGSPTARFGRMGVRPGAALSYFRDLLSGKHKPAFGHNPAGTLSVFAILLVLAIQIGTGLFVVDKDGMDPGPLSSFVSFDTGRELAEIHETSFNILVALIILHVAAIATYLIVFRDNLIRPMVTGRRSRADFEGEEVADSRASWLKFVIAAAIAAACVVGVLSV